MMGGEPGSQEDMFAKLESMRAVITEVNTQFKDPVRGRLVLRRLNYNKPLIGKDNVCLCLYL